jgi:hypothetical protein
VIVQATSSARIRCQLVQVLDSTWPGRLVAYDFARWLLITTPDLQPGRRCRRAEQCRTAITASCLPNRRSRSPNPDRRRTAALDRRGAGPLRSRRDLTTGAAQPCRFCGRRIWARPYPRPGLSACRQRLPVRGLTPTIRRASALETPRANSSLFAVCGAGPGRS